MADTNSAISQPFAPASNYWDNPANWAKPVQGNQFTTGTQALDSMGSINSENPASTGFSAANQGATGGGFNPQGSIPNTPAGQVATNTASTTGAQNAGVGNTGGQTGNTANSIIGTNQSLLNPQTGQNQQSNSQGSSGSGLSGFGNLVSSLGSRAGDALGLSGEGGLASQLAGSINTAGLGFGFGTGSSTLGAVGGSEASLLAGYGVAPGASSAASAAAADSVGGFSGFGASAGGELTSASLSDVLGGAGVGAGIGSIYGMLTGLGGSNATNADIGGGIGGAIGTAILPGIGTVLGSIGGSILGGLFGSGAGTNASGESGYLTPTGGLDNTITGGKNPNAQSASIVHQANLGFSNLTQQASQALGIKFNPAIDFDANYSSLHGGANIGVNSNGPAGNTGLISYDPSNATSVSNAFYQMLTAAAGYSGYTDTQAIHDWFYGQPAGSTQSNGGSSIAGTGVTIAPKGSTNNSGPIVA